MSPSKRGPRGMTAFAPNGAGGHSRRDLAIILIGAAREAGLDDAKAVVAAPGGFYISDELADLLYSEQEDEAPEPAKPAKKTSGNRAAKNSTTEQEQS